MNDLVEARWVEGSTLFIRFDDGTAGRVDLSGYRDRGAIFEPLREFGFFKGFVIEGGTLAWPNGADIAPERLYEMVIQQNAQVTSGHMAAPQDAVQDAHVKERSAE